MSTLGDLQKQITAIFAVAKARGFKTQDVIPAAIQSQFEKLKELKAAKDYIKEVEEREAQLKERNEQLEMELQAKKQEIEDRPSDFKQMEIDLNQARHLIECHKKLYDSSEERATRYQNKWQDTLKKQTATDALEETIECLQHETAQQRVSIQRLLEENRLANKLFEKLHDKDLKSLEVKESRIMELERVAAGIQARYVELEHETDQLEIAHADLIAQIEQANVDSSAAYINVSAKLRQAQRLHSATVSEIIPLRKFSESCWTSITIYQRIFQDLLNLNSNTVKTICLPDALSATLKDAASELEYYEELYYLMQADGMEVDGGRAQLRGLATSAANMHQSLQCIKVDVERFLSTLRQKPDVWKLMRMKFVGLKR